MGGVYQFVLSSLSWSHRVALIVTMMDSVILTAIASDRNYTFTTAGGPYVWPGRIEPVRTSNHASSSLPLDHAPIKAYFAKEKKSVDAANMIVILMRPCHCVGLQTFFEQWLLLRSC